MALRDRVNDIRRGAGAMTPEGERLLEEARRAPVERMSDRELVSEGLVALVFVMVAVILAEVTNGHVDVAVAAVLTIAFAFTCRVYFEVGAGRALPTQIVFVPMLLLLPPGIVPLLTLAGLVLSRIPDFWAGRRHIDRVVIRMADGWFSVGPVVVLLAAGVRGFHWGDWPWWVAALGAQFLGDVAVSSLREFLRAGRPPQVQLRELGLTWTVDLLLSPLGLLAAAAGAQRRFGFLLVLPLALLMWVFAQERKTRLDQQIEMSRTYRRTALLLGDVIGEDDEYTGAHSQGVVSLSLAVADEMGLGEGQRRLVEFGALLHDVGKIAMPKEIVNKPDRLTDEEWAIMRRHTIEGQRMLNRVGGILEDVGLVVRASHERWDGAGYPDGLVGEAIPLAARIVAAADAFSAMTTDRPYRTARDREFAISELRAQAGRQFDPRVAEATITIVERYGLPRRRSIAELGAPA
ncbi:MAG: hypothetical protein QOH62_3479 [Solirubrobacteraceae bacterium]|nr:hypothetical protein [Solirubrobacteraceae bacterium]